MRQGRQVFRHDQRTGLGIRSRSDRGSGGDIRPETSRWQPGLSAGNTGAAGRISLVERFRRGPETVDLQRSFGNGRHCSILRGDSNRWNPVDSEQRCRRAGHACARQGIGGTPRCTELHIDDHAGPADPAERVRPGNASRSPPSQHEPVEEDEDEPGEGTTQSMTAGQ